MSEEKKTSSPQENLRAVPADQRTAGPNATVFVSTDQVMSKLGNAKKQQVAVTGTPVLTGMADPVIGKTFRLEKEKNTVGRSETNDIVIEHPTISARHAQIVKENNIWRVINLISTNGTAVNGKRDLVSYLAPGDTITFGGVDCQFNVEGAAVSPSKGAESSTKSGSGGINMKVVAIVSVMSALVAGLAVLFVFMNR